MKTPDLMFTNLLFNQTEKTREKNYPNVTTGSEIPLSDSCDNKILFVNQAGLISFGILTDDLECISDEPVYSLEDIYGNTGLFNINGKISAETLLQKNTINLNKETCFTETAVNNNPLYTPSMEAFADKSFRQNNSNKVTELSIPDEMDSITSEFTVSPEGSVTTWNKNSEILFGYTEQELNGKMFFRLISAICHDKMAEFFRIVRQGKTIENHKVKMKRKKGEIIIRLITMSPIRDNEQNITGVSIFSCPAGSF